jgi:integrase
VENTAKKWAYVDGSSGLDPINGPNTDGLPTRLFGLVEKLYDLRHTFASRVAYGSKSLTVVGELLGHSSTRTTKRYVHFAGDALLDAADKATASIAAAAGYSSSAEVVPLKRRPRV